MTDMFLLQLASVDAIHHLKPEYARQYTPVGRQKQRNPERVVYHPYMKPV
jgi:hypothetical protein